MVGGQRDVSYNDIENHLLRAQSEGEQAPLEDEEKEEEKIEEFRPAGKLFGKSLIDDLEARKQEMRSKQRTFMGDERVSMMARSQHTLVDLIDTKFDKTLQRSTSRRRTLINLEDEERPGLGSMTKSTSVFGVDTVWERELKKLKEIQKQEADILAEENRRKEAAELAKKAKKSKGKPRKHVEAIEEKESVAPHVSDQPPVLPNFELRPTVRRIPEPESDLSSDEEDEERPVETKRPSTTWYAGDSDEERPVKLVSPPKMTNISPKQPRDATSDDDDDVPLVQVSRGLQAKVRLGDDDDDEEEDKPLSSVLEKMKGTGTAKLLSPPQQAKINDDDDDDEVPLAIKRLTTMGTFKALGRDDDDDQPLGLKVQRPNTQMMPQFAPSFPAMSMGAPSMMGVPMSFMQPQMIPSMVYSMPPPPPPEPAQNSIAKVDAWRRTVE